MARSKSGKKRRRIFLRHKQKRRKKRKKLAKKLRVNVEELLKMMERGEAKKI